MQVPIKLEIPNCNAMLETRTFMTSVELVSLWKHCLAIQLLCVLQDFAYCRIAWYSRYRLIYPISKQWLFSKNLWCPLIRNLKLLISNVCNSQLRLPCAQNQSMSLKGSNRKKQEEKYWNKFWLTWITSKHAAISTVAFHNVKP